MGLIPCITDYDYLSYIANNSQNNSSRITTITGEFLLTHFYSLSIFIGFLWEKKANHSPVGFSLFAC
jgi:hypothetical protein